MNTCICLADSFCMVNLALLSYFAYHIFYYFHYMRLDAFIKD